MYAIEIILLIYFVYVVLYSVVFSIAARFYNFNGQKLDQYKKICVLIPSYKEDNIILQTAKQALVQRYPKEYYDVVVIADSLKSETLQLLRSLPISVIEVRFEKSTKVKALNTALAQINGDYQLAVILDADNHMDFDFLHRLNDVIKADQVIQGQRKAKNSENNLAFLDGLSEAINTSIYRKGHHALNLSSSISGSGVIFPFPLLKEKLSSMESIGGFDRELELRLIEDGIKVKYYEDAVVYDEKVSNNTTFQNQRKRWISSQYFYLKRYFVPGVRALFVGNFTFFNSSVLRNIQLPRLLNIGLLTLITLAYLVFHAYLNINSTIWLALFILNATAIALAIPAEYYSKRLLLSMLHLPKLFLNLLLIMFRLKGANKKFIHTPHEVASKVNE